MKTSTKKVKKTRKSASPKTQMTVRKKASPRKKAARRAKKKSKDQTSGYSVAVLEVAPSPYASQIKDVAHSPGHKHLSRESFKAQKAPKNSVGPHSKGPIGSSMNRRILERTPKQ